MATSREARSRSTTQTWLAPRWASATPRLMASMVLPTPPLAVKTVMIWPSTVGPVRSVVVAARMRHDTSRERRQAAASAAWSPA